ncbi:MAG: hypothetical protein C0605_06870 [Hyphomicrobiales bacterium]|nr:MAG: hypothetical protein C0605_06870 [Hyphomicrobiales bacterium]
MSHRRHIAVTAAAAMVLILSTAHAPAAQTCRLGLNQSLICHTRTHINHFRGSWLKVPGLTAPKAWPLGNPAIQSCRHCLRPNRLNAQRLQALRSRR